MRSIYLDNNATTPLDPDVLEKMMPYLTQHYANASSVTHRSGRMAAEAVELARQQIADLVHADPSEITFTSGATESINTVLKGVFERYQSKGKHFVTCQTEHKAVLDTFEYLKTRGAEVTYLPVDTNGQIQLSDLEGSIRSDTVLVAIMSANNETGIKHPVIEIARITNKKGTLFFCDATQSIGKEFLDLSAVPIDLLCMSAHKMYGPKGVGALFVRKMNRRIQISPLLHGGNQEGSLRAGTLNVPGIVGMGAAAAQAKVALEDEQRRISHLRIVLEQGLSSIPEITIQGQQVSRLSNVCHITFKHLRASEIMTNAPELALSTGSACVSGDRNPSHVLLAMALSKEEAYATLRISLGRFTTSEEIFETIIILTECVDRLRAQSPTWKLFKMGLL